MEYSELRILNDQSKDSILDRVYAKFIMRSSIEMRISNDGCFVTYLANCSEMHV